MDQKISLLPPLTMGLSFALVPALMILTYKFLSKIPYFKVDHREFVEPMEEREFHRWNLKSAALLLGLLPITALVFYLTMRSFEQIARMLIPRHQHALFLVDLAAMLPAAFAGMALTGLITNEILKRWIKVRFRNYVRSNELKYPARYESVGIALCGTLFLLAVISFVYISTYFSYFTEDTIFVRQKLSLRPKSYPLKEISEIVRSQTFRAPNGTLIGRINHRVIFKDGWEWRLDNEPEEEHFLKSLSEKTGLPIFDRNIE